MTGKLVSAILTISTLLWLVRLLPVDEYGVYVSFTAGMELILSLSALGLPWMAARYVPEFRLHAAGRGLCRFVWSLLGIALGLLAVALVLAFGVLADALALLKLVGYEDVAAAYLLVIFIEGSGRFVRDRLLGPLMQQVPLRLSQIVRQIAFLLLLAWFASGSGVRLLDVVHADMVAATAGTLVALSGLSRHLGRIVRQPGTSAWRPPTWREMWRTGHHMYFARLVTLLSSVQMFTLLVQRYLGPEAAALFGFLRNLHDQIAGYLPANLLFTVIQPKLVASYVAGGGSGELARNANLAGKLSLFVLMPLIAIAAASGDFIISAASGGKFPHAGLMFFALMLTLVPFSQRLLLETVAMAAGNTVACVRAAFMSVPAVAAAYGMMIAGGGVWSAIIGLGLSYVLFNVVVLLAMRRRCNYRGDTVGTMKLTLAALAAYGFTIMLGARQPDWMILAINVITVCTVYLVVAWLLKPFTRVERSRLNGVLPRRLFIW